MTASAAVPAMGSYVFKVLQKSRTSDVSTGTLTFLTLVVTQKPSFLFLIRLVPEHAHVVNKKALPAWTVPYIVMYRQTIGALNLQSLHCGFYSQVSFLAGGDKGQAHAVLGLALYGEKRFQSGGITVHGQ